MKNNMKSVFWCFADRAS